MKAEPKKLLLVGGHVASGKTRYCHALASEEGSVFVQYDSFLESTRQKYGIQTSDEWLALDREARTQIVSESWQAGLERAKEALLRPEVERVILENPFRLVERARDAMTVAEEAGADVALHMLFRPNIRRNMETAIKRDGLGGQEAALAYVREIAGYERDAASAFHEYVEMGLHVELYENRFQDGLKLISEGRQGSLHIYDPKAYAVFSIKRYLDPNAGFRIVITNGNTLSIGSRNPFLVPPDATHVEKEVMQREQAHFRQVLPDLPD